MTLTAQWSRPEEERAGTPLLVMLHGYGSHEDRMVERFSAMPSFFTCAALRGPFDMDGEYGWFLLDYFLNNDFAEVISAATKVFAWIDTAVANYQFSSVALLGHSQGMAMTTTLLRLRPEGFNAVVGISGFALDNPLLAAAAQEPLSQRRPFLWAHDPDDLVINPQAISFTEEWLAENTILQEEIYTGPGHTVSPAMLQDVCSFLTIHTTATPTA